MNLKKKLIPALIAPLALGLSFSGQALANDSDELEKLRSLVQELDQKVRILDRKGELADEAATEKKKVTPIVKASQDGFGLESADGQNKIKFKALAQIDYRSYVNRSNQTANIDGFDFRRIRPSVEGTVFGIYDFKFVPEFGENKTSGIAPVAADGLIKKSSSNSGIVDAYIDARFKPWFQVRAGKFKPYVGLERQQSGADTKFIERSYVSNNILPNRDLGVSVHGDLFGDKLTYAVGVFNGVVDGGDNVTSQDLNGDKDFAARLFTTPFKGEDSLLAGLGFGIAATHTNTNGPSNYGSITSGLPDYKTPGQQASFFTYSSGTAAQGVRNRWAPQAYYYYGPFGVLAEYAQVDQHIYNSGNANNKAASLSNDAWHVTASWLITGEDASFKGIKPKNVFNPDGAGWGAWEIVARYQENNIDNAAFSTGSNGANTFFADPTTASKSAESWAIGINWYLNQNIKIATDYEQTSFKWGGGGTKTATSISALDRADEKTLFTRLQVSY